uniref:glucan endo-1,3-beta-D-glucosidase n=1 Tax=Kalanchoe fedtschenkoi TaxID=63787 RepID=A0A7N0V8M4_KALFE
MADTSSLLLVPSLIFSTNIIFSAVLCGTASAVSFGVNYGQIANNLPSPTRVSFLLRSLNVTRVKLYDADPNVLRAFSYSPVHFIVGLGNEHLPNLTTDPLHAQRWIQLNLQPHLPQTRITSITVGNEVFNTPQLIPYLLPAMQAVHSALVNLGLDSQVSVTTAHSLTILSTSSPPSSGTFRPDLAQYLRPILDFLSAINSAFLINAYPYFAYKDDPAQVPLDYVLFRPNQGAPDPFTGFTYDNMLYAQVDAVYAAIRTLGHEDIEVKVSETGWPSRGDPDEAGATPEYAGVYNGNLFKRIAAGEGTPARPDVPIDVYVFALFNENLKPGPASERNYGLYYPSGVAVYNFGLQGYLPQLTLSDSTANSVKVIGSLSNLFRLIALSLCACIT